MNSWDKFWIIYILHTITPLSMAVVEFQYYFHVTNHIPVVYLCMYFPFRIEIQVPFFILVFLQNFKIKMLSLEVYDIYLYSFNWF